MTTVIGIAEVNSSTRMRRVWKVPPNIIPKGGLYHLTPKKNVAAIRKSGIKVGSKRATQGGIIRGVYLTDDPIGVIRGGDFPGADVSVLVINAKGLQLIFDQEFYPDYDNEKDVVEAIKDNAVGFNCFSVTSIPASRILRVSDYDHRKNRY